jgi:hypothetical protein
MARFFSANRIFSAKAFNPQTNIKTLKQAQGFLQLTKTRTKTAELLWRDTRFMQ